MGGADVTGGPEEAGGEAEVDTVMAVEVGDGDGAGGGEGAVGRGGGDGGGAGSDGGDEAGGVDGGTAGAEEVQATLRFVALAGATVAVSRTLSAGFSVFAVRSRVTPVAATWTAGQTGRTL